MSYMIIAVDPGKTCGIATWSDTTEYNFSSWEWGRHQTLTWADAIIKDWVGGDLTVVCEKFTINQGTVRRASDAHWAIGCVETLKYFCGRAGIQIDVTQTPASAKKIATNAVLERLGWRNPTKGGHADDAARHLVTYLLRSGLLDPSRLVA